MDLKNGVLLERRKTSRFIRRNIKFFPNIVLGHFLSDAVQKPPFPGVSECKYRIRTPDRALTITVFTDIGAVGTVIFLYIRKVLS